MSELLKDAGIASAHRGGGWSVRRVVTDAEVEALVGTYETRVERDQDQLDAMVAYADGALSLARAAAVVPRWLGSRRCLRGL